MQKLNLEEIKPKHESRLIQASIRSQELHHPWVQAPCTSEDFARQLKKFDPETNLGYMVVNESDEIVSWISLTEIVRGNFQCAYIGYCVFVPFDGKGLMSQAMRMVLVKAFGELGLHRIEANIQPENINSSRLVRAVGFRLEGVSPRYLKIDDKWRDHERYAITCEEFEASY